MGLLNLIISSATFVLLVVTFKRVSKVSGDNQSLRDLINDVSAKPGDFLKD